MTVHAHEACDLNNAAACEHSGGEFKTETDGTTWCNWDTQARCEQLLGEWVIPDATAATAATDIMMMMPGMNAPHCNHDTAAACSAQNGVFVAGVDGARSWCDHHTQANCE